MEFDGSSNVDSAPAIKVDRTGNVRLKLNGGEIENYKSRGIYFSNSGDLSITDFIIANNKINGN